MFEKRFFLWIIIIVFLSQVRATLASSFMFNDSTEKENIRSLEKMLYNFEVKCYQDNNIKSETFDKIYKTLDQLIQEYLNLFYSNPEAMLAEKAFFYLQKLKNWRLFQLYSQSDYVKQTRQRNKSELLKLHRLVYQVDQVKSDLLFGNTQEENRLKLEKTALKTYLDSLIVKYHELTYYWLLQVPVEFKEVQSFFVDKKAGVLDYWLHGDSISVFVIAPDTVIIAHWKISTKELEQQVYQLMEPLFNCDDLFNLKFDYNLSYEVYLSLFKPIKKELLHLKRLIIIPDGYLVSFPFEALVVDTLRFHKSKSQILYSHYRDMKFLIHEYAISYNYSIAALNPALLKIHSRKKLGRRLLTMREPIIIESNSLPENKLPSAAIFDLKNSNKSAQEIKRVSRLLWRHSNLKQDQVLKSYLIEKGSDYRWIYLAQPGILNNTEPLSSGLLFSKLPEDNTGESIWLSVEDVMKANLRADMLTMSCCKLSPPFSKDNFGVIALPQAFLFSGIRSVVNSLWQINDISTSQFMAKFYWELKYKRQLNTNALQEAKVVSINDSFNYMGEEISRAHPYFWANFRLIGDAGVRPPSNAKIPPQGVVALVYVLVFLISLLIIRKTVEGRREKQISS